MDSAPVAFDALAELWNQRDRLRAQLAALADSIPSPSGTLAEADERIASLALLDEVGP